MTLNISRSAGKTRLYSRRTSHVSLTGILFLIPAVVFLLYANFIPFFWNMVLAFQKWNGFKAATWIGAKNFRRAFGDELVWKSLGNSLYLAIVSTAGSVVLGILLAAFLYRLGRREGSIFRLILFMPSMMPIAVIALLFTFIYNPSMGILNNLLILLGKGDLTTAWLEDQNTVLFCIAVVNIFRMTGSTMLLCFASMQVIPSSFLESSILDGAGYAQQYFRIILPLIKPTILISTINTLTTNFKTYDTVFILTRGGPGNFSKTVPIYMTETAFINSEFGYSAAMGVILTVTIMLIIVTLRKFMGGEQHEL
jgi:ABC-type sugar transport system permease subunit